MERLNHNFVHIPKTAGSTLQFRLCYNEWAGNLPKGSTLVTTYANDLNNRLFHYRIEDDDKFDPKEHFFKAFDRQKSCELREGNAWIMMGHAVHCGYEGAFYTWLRHPLKRDLSHLNFVWQFRDFDGITTEQLLDHLIGNFQTDFLYEEFLGIEDDSSPEYRYRQVRNALRDFANVWDSDNFESSYTEISKILDIPSEPRINTNRAGIDHPYRLKSISEIDEKAIKRHQEDNYYDYLLYEEFCNPLKGKPDPQSPRLAA